MGRDATVGKQRAHATMEELSEAVFSVRSMPMSQPGVVISAVGSQLVRLGTDS
jgi:hypothetical protein